MWSGEGSPHGKGGGVSVCVRGGRERDCFWVVRWGFVRGELCCVECEEVERIRQLHCHQC